MVIFQWTFGIPNFKKMANFTMAKGSSLEKQVSGLLQMSLSLRKKIYDHVVLLTLTPGGMAARHVV
jgi:hypothetical protein